MRFLSVCSGIEAASVAWHPLGWRAWAYSEIEPFPCAVLAHHYPDTPNLGDMTKFKDWPDGSIDLLCGGTPCQSFSNAGLRAGLDDPRGQLMLTFGAIAARYRPRWLVWENVPGVLSSNGGRDLGAFLGLLGHLGYGFAYRVLDAQFVRVDGYARAVPQRRQRVFVVGCLGDWRSAAAVLLERESLRGDPAPRRSSGTRVTTCLDAGPDIGGDGSRVSRLVPVSFDTTQITSALNRSNPKAGDPCHPLAAGAHAPAVAFCWQNAAAQGMPVDSISPTLDKSKHPAALTFQERGRNGGRSLEIGGEIAYALTAPAGGGRAQERNVMCGAAVRRLMPTECEAIQGFSRGYTAIPWRGKPASECPDGPRYKALGNSWAVNTARWVGARIAIVDQINQRMEIAA